MHLAQNLFWALKKCKSLNDWIGALVYLIARSSATLIQVGDFEAAATKPVEDYLTEARPLAYHVYIICSETTNRKVQAVDRHPVYRRLTGLAVCLCILCLAGQASEETSTAKILQADKTPVGDQDKSALTFAGTSSCRECHENFYQLWAPSHHGLAMQPYTETFAQDNLTEHPGHITVGTFQYQAVVGPDQGHVLETGPEGSKKYRIEQVLGGKNVYYFLTPWLRGRLQTLPLAYNVNTKAWFDTAASGVRHFPGNEQDERVHWTDPLYTFNTSCYDCHVSQLASNYDLETDTYQTEWAEAGINCETCHGPSQLHVKNYKRARETGIEPNELGLISTHSFNREQTNGMCNSCHAKMSPITASFDPGERFFDHFDLITLDNADFYPDGRDLGENYTMTSWRMSGCFKSGQMDCMHCHTSSGRYRFSEPDNALGACLPCHQSKADNFEAHTHHKREEKGPVCISCHMPMTAFAHMNRSDHSMRPPLPGVSAEFKSDVACLLCHTDQKAEWADKNVREWHGDTFQQPYLDQARLLDQARRGRWKNLDAMLASVQKAGRDEIYATSLIRSLVACEDNRKWPVLIDTLKKDPSPLVRSAAATALDGYYVDAGIQTLLAATQDDYRLVRVRAASSLAALPRDNVPKPSLASLEKATQELETSFTSRQDDFAAHFNRGNYLMNRLDYDAAIEAFETTHKLRPDFQPPYVNRAFAHNAKGQNSQAELAFLKALKIDPNSVPVHINLGMLLGEMERIPEAEKAFRRAAQLDPNNPVPAFNLGILLAEKDPPGSLAWCQKAYTLQPNNGRYGYTYAFYLSRQGQFEKPISILEKQINGRHATPDAYMFLAQIYQSLGQHSKAKYVFERALKNLDLSPQDRMMLQRQIQNMP